MKAKTGLKIDRVFTDPSRSAFESVEWETRTAQIVNSKGEVIFEQKDVEVPKSWSMTATNIVASKYLHGKLGTPECEKGVRDLIGRVATTITQSGETQGYLTTGEDREAFFQELVYILVNQYASFNSPVWFNTGCHLREPDAQASNWHYNFDSNQIEFGSVGYNRPQCSACFINSVEDSMEGIMELARKEAMLFKFGSGTGTNLSPLRSSLESVSGGGVASGPLSFMKGYDAFAGVIKSGGKTRRAAKMVILNADHPDIEEFVECKMKEEAKAHALIAAGYDGSTPDSEAYSSIFFQNSNNSVRATDQFMLAVKQLNQDLDWELKSVKTGETVKKVKAHALMEKIAKATWQCGDPGMQFDTTINKWHTSPNTARINASNPCSEYMFLDDSACNLASINLLKFLRKNGTFDADKFRHVVRILITAQDILVDLAGYPAEMIARNSHDYRPLGLGYANLGALLMAMGLAYDSDEGRTVASAITSIMTGEAYWQSAKIASVMPPLSPVTDKVDDYLLEAGWPNTTGACPGFFMNRRPFLKVIGMHLQETVRLLPVDAPNSIDLAAVAHDVWKGALSLGDEFGYRNAQVTVLAPTGTIGFMMDCDTTGIEPELGLVKYKKLVGGGMMKLVNETIPRALSKLGYKTDLAAKIVKYIEENGTVEGSDLSPSHYPVFDTSFKPAKGTRSIHWLGHVKMMAAAQPFLSGAISKTINMPEESTTWDITQAYIEAWELGLKAVAIYRDGSKKNQVLVTKKDDPKTEVVVPEMDLSGPPRAVRHKLPDERQALAHKFHIAGHEGYVHVGLYPNGQPGEIFVTMSKEGSTISGLMDSFALAVSLGLQHGVPLKVYIDKLAHTRFEPAGWSGHPDIKFAHSPMDYIMRWMDLRFQQPQQQKLFDTPVAVPEKVASVDTGVASDAPLCQNCGSIMTRNGSCFKCANCGGTSGCS